MQKLLLIILIIVLGLTTGFAQEEPIPPPRSSALKVGGLGGFTPGWLLIDVKPMNDFLVPALGAPLKDSGVPMYGGGGSLYIMLVKNLRVGGWGMSGSLKSTSLDGLGVRRDAELTVGFGGVTFEYVVPVFEDLDIAFGGMLGTGGIDLTIRNSKGAASTWQQQWEFLKGTPGAVPNMTRKLSGSYFVWIPTFNVEYAALGWLGFRIGASYVGMSAPSWTVDDNYDLLGVPSSVTGKGVMINAGILVGTF